MIRRPPRSTRTDTLFPYTTLCRSNLRLGFPVEARDFAIAARMLAMLGVSRIRLMTNNPEKVARLEKEGVEVVERIPLALPTNKYNAQYIATKRDRNGHQIRPAEGRYQACAKPGTLHVTVRAGLAEARLFC